jgi:mRNA-degrading endonuclease toxin of MazEF toxin-antitoxin module
VSAASGAAIREPNLGRGCAFGDFDNDGDIDVIVNNLDGPPTLLRNDGGNRNTSIAIKCVGTRSNRSAIGTRVRVTTGSRTQIDEVRSGSSYYSQNDLRLHFGLGQAAKADVVELAWPSGAKETVRDLAANQRYVIQESKGVVSSARFG